MRAKPTLFLWRGVCYPVASIACRFSSDLLQIIARSGKKWTCMSILIALIPLRKEVIIIMSWAMKSSMDQM